MAAFRKANLPIVIVHVIPSGATWTKARKDAKQPQHAPGEDWTEITPEIKTEAGDIFITKRTWAAFYQTSLDEELKKRNITGIVMGGISTSIGVEGTAREAMQRGYNITAVRDLQSRTPIKGFVILSSPQCFLLA